MEIGKNRQPWINCLKLVCTFLIVMQHSISDAWITLDLYKASWLPVSILMTIAKEGVPLFFMCSGYGMLKRQRSIKECIFSVLRILIVYTAWMCVYGLVDAYFAARAGQSVGVILKFIVKPVIFGHYHTWFLFVLMGLYLMTPILYPVMQNKNTALYAVIISAIATIVVNMMWDIKGISRFENTLLSFNLSYLAGDIMYYLLGYYLGTYIPSGKKKTILKWMGICCIVIGIAINIATVYYDRIKGEISGIFFDDKRIEYFDDKHSVDEDRWLTIGMVRSVLCVIHTERGEATRLISARRATPRERSLYYGQYTDLQRHAAFD